MLPATGVGEACEGCVNTICISAANGRSTLFSEVKIDSVPFPWPPVILRHFSLPGLT